MTSSGKGARSEQMSCHRTWCVCVSVCCAMLMRVLCAMCNVQCAFNDLPSRHAARRLCPCSSPLTQSSILPCETLWDLCTAYLARVCCCRVPLLSSVLCSVIWQRCRGEEGETRPRASSIIGGGDSPPGQPRTRGVRSAWHGHRHRRRVRRDTSVNGWIILQLLVGLDGTTIEMGWMDGIGKRRARWDRAWTATDRQEGGVS